MNEVFVKRVEQRVRRPKPVEGLTATRIARSWDYDPSIAIERDIRDQKGNRIAAAGHRVNPLDFVEIKLGRASCRERVVSTCRSRWAPTPSKNTTNPKKL